MILSDIKTGPMFDLGLATEDNDSFFFNQLPSDQLTSLLDSTAQDVIMLLGGNDLASDNESNRTYFGMAGNDTISGNQGADNLYGGQDNDQVFGGKGQDTLTGDLGEDALFGNADNDVLNGGAGNDTLTGGAGRDLFIISNTEGTDLITDFEHDVDSIQLPEGVTFNDIAFTTTETGQLLITNKTSNQSIAILAGVAANTLTETDFIRGTSDGTPDPFGEQLSIEYQAYLTPAQEPGEPNGSNARGVGTIRFPKNLSYGQVDVQMTGVNVGDVTGFHIHCGPPGVLGPILLNLGQYGGFDQTINNGRFLAKFTNENITLPGVPQVLPNGVPQIPDEGLAPPSSHSDGPVPSPSGEPQIPDGLPRLPEGCQVAAGLPSPVTTVAGVEAVAKEGALYFNLHTEQNNFYGEMRGQVYPAR